MTKGIAYCDEKEMFDASSLQYLEAPTSITYRFFTLSSLSQQHLLSPQRAPERFLQLAQENLDTLMTEMDELLTRVCL